jgi:hypothetical protein
MSPCQCSECVVGKTSAGCASFGIAVDGIVTVENLNTWDCNVGRQRVYSCPIWMYSC